VLPTFATPAAFTAADEAALVRLLLATGATSARVLSVAAGAGGLVVEVEAVFPETPAGAASAAALRAALTTAAASVFPASTYGAASTLSLTAFNMDAVTDGGLTARQKGAIAGGVVGGVAAVALATAAVVAVRRRRQRAAAGAGTATSAALAEPLAAAG
jgi:hypothetical protein